MKRPWTALSPCPIAKELVPVHPRKVFFFLTTQPRGQLPANSDDIIAPVIVDIKRLTPSISDPSIEEEDDDRHERMRFSPSPEVELFSPELDHASPLPPTPGSPFNSHSLPEDPMPMPQPRPRAVNRAPSPGLEADERGFTETASAVRASRLLQQTSELQINIAAPVENLPVRPDHEVGMELFGRSHGGLSVLEQQKHLVSSPMMVPKHNPNLQLPNIDTDMDDMNWNIKSPEATSFDEIDQMFDDLY